MAVKWFRQHTPGVTLPRIVRINTITHELTEFNADTMRAVYQHPAAASTIKAWQDAAAQGLHRVTEIDDPRLPNVLVGLVEVERG